MRGSGLQAVGPKFSYQLGKDFKRRKEIIMLTLTWESSGLLASLGLGRQANFMAKETVSKLGLLFDKHMIQWYKLVIQVLGRG